MDHAATGGSQEPQYLIAIHMVLTLQFTWCSEALRRRRRPCQNAAPRPNSLLRHLSPPRGHSSCGLHFCGNLHPVRGLVAPRR